MSSKDKMHQDLEALEICCKHYRMEYSDKNLRKVKNKNRCLQRKLERQAIEIFCLRASLHHWSAAYRNLEKLSREFLQEVRALTQRLNRLSSAYVNDISWELDELSHWAESRTVSHYMDRRWVRQFCGHPDAARRIGRRRRDSDVSNSAA